MIKRFLKKIWETLKDPLNLVIYVIVVIMFYSPTIIGYTLSMITKNAWHSTYATAYWLFWIGPFTPAIPIQIAITLGIRKIINILKGKNKNGT